MEYEKIIIELLGRIQTLEEQVAVLMGEQLRKEEKEEEKMTTDDIRGYIQKQKEIAKMAGKSPFVGKSPIDPFCGTWATRAAFGPVCSALEKK